MALEPLTLTPPPADADTDGVDGNRTARLPRWTRQEILVLIQGKRVAENRVRRGRTAGLVGPVPVEPKWASVSSYCKRHGVNRGPVQCRKRWSNLAGDYKKIKEWEINTRDETESFWVMRNDLRREKKLPGFFDKEVYDILDGGSGSEPGGDSGPGPGRTVEVKSEVVFDSGRADDGLFSDFEQSGQEETGRSPEKELSPVKEAPAITLAVPIPISEKQYQPSQECPPQDGTLVADDTPHEKPRTSNPETETTHEESRKRKRLETDVDEETNMQHQLIEVLERNGRLLSSQLEAQNTNFELDMAQRKDHSNSLVEVLHKLADAFGRIADKL